MKDMTIDDTAVPRRWDQFAGQRTKHGSTVNEYADFFPHPSLVKMSGHEIVHEVTLVEDPTGELLGWIDADDPDDITMVQHHMIFSVQFPYGIQADIDRDYGEVVPLRAEARNADQDPTGGTR